MGARVASAVLGLWLFLSGFLWPQNIAQRNNAWVVGVLAVTAALAGLDGPRIWRLIGAGLGGWLIVSALLLSGDDQITYWNHVLVGFGLVLFGVAPTARSIRRRTPVHP